MLISTPFPQVHPQSTMFVSSSSVLSFKSKRSLKKKISPRVREHDDHDAIDRRPRCLLSPLNGPGLLTLSCGVGLATQRLESLPPMLRGPSASFISAALLRGIAGAAVQPACDAVLGYAPAGLALLLLTGASSANKDTPVPSRGMVVAFCLGAFGAAAGAALGSVVLSKLGSNLAVLSMKTDVIASLAAAFAATYIGGSLNLVAVVSATGLREIAPQAVAAAFSVDLVLMAAYFGGLFFLSSRISRRRDAISVLDSNFSGSTSSPVSVSHGSHSSLGIQSSPALARISQMAKVCALPLVSVVIYIASRWAVSLAGLGGGADILLVTFLSIAFRRGVGIVFPKESTIFVDICLVLFFAALGGCVTLTGLGASLLPVAFLACSSLLVHTLAMLFAWKAVGIRPEQCLVASNANIGGPTTSCAFAAAEGYTSLVGAAACIGATGYIVATPIALLLKSILQALL